jgi:uncharacterized protein YegP (UPF0339 family)
MVFHIEKGSDGFYWHLIAANGKIVAWSGESYHNKLDCQHGISLVKGSFNAPVIDHTR